MENLNDDLILITEEDLDRIMAVVAYAKAHQLQLDDIFDIYNKAIAPEDAPMNKREHNAILRGGIICGYCETVTDKGLYRHLRLGTRDPKRMLTMSEVEALLPWFEYHKGLMEYYYEKDKLDTGHTLLHILDGPPGSFIKRTE